MRASRLEKAIIGIDKDDWPFLDCILLLTWIIPALSVWGLRICRSMFAHMSPLPYTVSTDAAWITQEEAESMVAEAAAMWERPIGRKLFRRSDCGLSVEFSSENAGQTLGLYLPLGHKVKVYSHANSGNNDRSHVMTTVAHELGHVLGMFHSDGPLDIMHSPSAALLSVSPSEAAKMRRRYG